MSDITKCSGVGCSRKSDCYRVSAPDGQRQSYFFLPPVKPDGTCDHLWPIKKKDSGK